MNQPNKLVYADNPEEAHASYLQDIAHNVGYFTEHPYRRLGDSDSGHGVLFGNLAPYGDVAIKPFLFATRAEHEKEILDHAKGLGFETIEPIAIASEGLYAHLISRYRTDLRHLGQVNWNENIASRRLRKVITPTLNLAADYAGALHTRGMTHGDLQAKNVFISSAGDYVLGDMENGQMKLSGNELARKSERDLVGFGISVLRRGLLEDRSLRYRLGYLTDEFIEPALEISAQATDYDRVRAVRERIAKSSAITIGASTKRSHRSDKKIAA